MHTSVTAGFRVQIATSIKDGTKYAVKIIKKADGKEALLLQLQSKHALTRALLGPVGAYGKAA